MALGLTDAGALAIFGAMFLLAMPCLILTARSATLHQGDAAPG